MQPNLGTCPPRARGRRVAVRLRNGYRFDAPADGKQGCDWSLSLGPFTIEEWELR